MNNENYYSHGFKSHLKINGVDRLVTSTPIWWKLFTVISSQQTTELTVTENPPQLPAKSKPFQQTTFSENIIYFI